MADEARLHELLDIAEQALAEGDSVTAEKAKQAYLRESGQPAAKAAAPAAAAPAREMGHAEAAVANANNGLLLGYGDEVSAFFDAISGKLQGDGRGFGDLYSSAHAAREQSRGRHNAEYPLAGGIAEVMGGAPAAAVVPQAALGQQATGGILRMMGRGAAAGAGYGAVAGAGNAAPDERGMGALKGAAAGAAVGGAVPGAVEIAAKLRAPVQSLASYVSRVTGQNPPLLTQTSPAASTGAMDRVLQAIERDGMTPSMVADRAAQGRAAGVPISIADAAGESTRRLGRAAVTLPGPAREVATSSLNSRAAGQAGRIDAAVQAGVGSPLAPGEISAAVTARGNAARPLYARVNDYGPVNDLSLMGELTDRAPVYAPRHEAARRLVRSTEGRDIPPLFDDSGKMARLPTLEDIDLIKRGIDRELYSNKRGLIEPQNALDATGKANLKKNRAELLRQADRAVPFYGEVRKKFAGDTQVLEAAEMGGEALNMTAKEIREALAGMESEAEKTMFRRAAVGAVQARLKQAADTAEYPNLVKSIFGYGRGSKREQLAEIFGDSKKFGQFEEAMRAEMQGTTTRNAIMGGSNTADKLAEAADLGSPLADTAESVAKHGLFKTASDAALRHTVGRAQAGATEKTREQIARELFNTGNQTRMDDFLRALDDLKRQRESAQGRRAGALLFSALGAE